MKRSEALEIIRGSWPKDMQYMEALRTLIPELKESEDERIRQDCIKYLDWEYQHCSINEDKIKIEKCIAWLEKQGSQNLANSTKTCKVEQNHGWSEDDEDALRVVTNIFEQHGVKLLCYPAFVHWLKTLPNRITFNPYWKPSDEQMEYLAKAITTLGNEGDNKTSAILHELQTDLKKLKG